MLKAQNQKPWWCVMQVLQYNKAKQQGMALLGVVILLLTVMALLALMSMKNVTTEQRITGNDVRKRQALAAADAGLAIGIAKAVAESGSITTNFTYPETGGDSLATLNDAYFEGNSANPGYGQIRSILICPIDPPVGDGGKFKVIAVGESPDGTATRTVEQWIQIGSSIDNAGYVMGTWKDYGVINAC